MQWTNDSIDDPESLAGQLGYEFRQRLRAPSSAAELLLVRDRTGTTHVLKFPAGNSSLAVDSVLDELRSRSDDATNRLHVPTDTGADPRGRFYTVAPYCREGSLDHLLAGGNPLPPSAVRPLIRDLAAACRQLHETVAGRRLVHRDIKPSNVLIFRRGTPEVDWEFRLADLDTCLLLGDDGQPAGVPARTTVGYAAPETLRGDATADPANDYWSFGMLVWTALRGSHYFHGQSAEEIRNFLVEEEWTFDAGLAAAIDDEAYRGLLGGLLHRVAAERWGIGELQRWLRNDPPTIARGLRRLGENPAETPFRLGGETVHTVGNVAVTLLRTWGTVASSELVDWMEALSPTAAEQLRGLGGNDRNLLEFCGTYYPGDLMPPVWRREAITASSLAGLANRALGGDGDAREQLLSLLREGGGRTYFESRFQLSRYRQLYGEVSGLFRHIDRTREAYEAAWQEILDAGAPGDMPTDEECLSHAASIACTRVEAEERRAVLARLFEPRLIMTRADWFFVFGTDPERINPSQLSVLQTLENASLLQVLNVVDPRAGIDPAQLRDDVVLPSTQHRLLSSFFVRPGATFVTLSAGDTHDSQSDRTQPRSRAERTGVADAGGDGSQPRLDVRLLRLTLPRTDPDEHEFHLALITWSGARPYCRLVLAGRFGLPRYQVRVAEKGRMLFVVHGATRIRLGSGLLGFGRLTQPVRIEPARTFPLPLRRTTRLMQADGRIRSVVAFVRWTSASIVRTSRLKAHSKLHGATPGKAGAIRRPTPLLPVSRLRSASTRLLGPAPFRAAALPPVRRDESGLLRRWQRRIPRTSGGNQP